MGDATQVHLDRWERHLRDSGYETLTVSLEPFAGIAGPRQRIRVPSLLPAFVRYTVAIPLVRRIVRRFEPDLINAHFLPNYGFIAAACGFEPWVLSTWGSDVMILPDRSLLHMYRTRKVIERATAITSDADVMTRRLVELGARPERVTTFPMGVDRTVFRPFSRGEGSVTLRIVTNRKLKPVYNIETILSAFPAVIRNEPEAMLTVAGDGELSSALRATAARLVPGDSIRFVGQIAHSELPGLLGRHEIYVSMSLSDTTSVSLLEAMACGLFPVVSDIPANRAWIEHNHNGILVSPRDADGLSTAIVGAWRDPELRRSAAAHNARIIEQRADWHDNMNVLNQLFDRILSGRMPADLS
jgi:glycosyltransferase involved in cell wall biosynthesis